MNEANASDAPKSVTSVWPAVAVLVFAVVMYVIARSYSPTAARFPALSAGVLIVLSLLDIWSRTRLPGAKLVETFGGTSFRRREMMHNPGFAAQAECVGWILVCFALMATVGILAASPIFCAAFARVHGRKSLAASALVGVLVLIFQVAVFEWALDYTLYRGLFFTKGGISAW